MAGPYALLATRAVLIAAGLLVSLSVGCSSDDSDGTGASGSAGASGTAGASGAQPDAASEAALDAADSEAASQGPEAGDDVGLDVEPEGAEDAGEEGEGGKPWCTDIAPPGDYTCGQQVGWNKCGESWMVGYCDRSCARCPGIGNGGPECSDLPPDSNYTCKQQAGWGKCGEAWMQDFCLRSCGRCEVTRQLIDPDATANASRLFNYLADSFGKQVIAGQQGRDEAQYFSTLTGKYPAILGLDLMDYSPSRVEFGATSNVIELAIDWWQTQRGILTLSWHWNAPSGLLNTQDHPWWQGFYTEATTFDVALAMQDLGSEEYKLVLRDLDAIAAQLKRLQNVNAPVLFRPLHEASDGWFWWGAKGPEPYLALWRLTYDRLVNFHKLHNLIWVWNGQAPDWYPGDQYADVVAEDIYVVARDYGPREPQFLAASQYATSPKLVALSETGGLPDPDLLVPSAARWSWFNLWSGDEFALTEKWNEDSMKKKVYQSSFVVTLEELPDLESYVGP